MTDAPRRQFGFDTRMLHAGHVPDAVVGARAVPIYQTTSYVFDDAETAAQLFELKQYGNIYTRIGNPTTAVLEERIASLENATGAVAVASGMAAQFVALMTLLSPGDEIVASSHLYGGTVTQFTHTFRKLSIGVHFVDPTRLDYWEQAITPRTRALYGETVGNPRGSILDLEPLAALSPSYHGLRFYDTFGHYGFLMKVRAETVRDTGACLSPTNAFLLLQGLETLSLRMERHTSNALGV